MSVLRDAERIVRGARSRQYGEPVECMKRTAQAWSGVLGVDVSPRQVALCLAALKLVREAHRHAEDNLIDAAGYILIADKCAGGER